MGQAAPAMSVVIPTLNRADSLQETLQALARQETAGRFAYEVVVVDNGSTDATRQHVTDLSRTFPAPLRYVHEPRRGRPMALNAGLRAAAGRIVVITDDDLLPAPQWLAAFWSAFQEPGTDGVAGRVLPIWPNGRPSWMTPEVLQSLSRLGLGCLDHGEERLCSRDRRNCRWVGGNMAIRREAVERIGGFDERMIRGQDREFYERCIERGLTVWYEPAALASHKLTADRLTPAYLRRWRHRQGYYDAYLMPWRVSHLLTIMPLAWYLKVLGTAAHWVGLHAGGSWWARFHAELVLRQEASAGWHRLRLWPRWWLTVLSGRSFLPPAMTRLEPASTRPKER